MSVEVEPMLVLIIKIEPPSLSIVVLFVIIAFNIVILPLILSLLTYIDLYFEPSANYCQLPLNSIDIVYCYMASSGIWLAPRSG